MITASKKYSKDNFTNGDIFGEIPKHWSVRRMRYLATINPRQLPHDVSNLDEVSFIPMECVNEYGGLVLENTKAPDEIGNGYTFFREDDIVVAKITPCFENGKGAIAKGLKNQVAFGTTELHVIRAGTEMDKAFLFYLTISEIFRKSGEGHMYGAGGQKRISDKFIKDYRTPVPPIDEQKSIANFLNKRTKQIDDLIEQKEKLLQLLTEKRTAIITQAVTKGLNPKVKMKDSGIKWLGDVPEHWDVLPLKFALKSLNNRRIPLSAEERGPMSKNYPYYGASGIIDYVEDFLFDEPTILIGEDGANLLSRSTPLAFVATGKYWVNNHAHILKPEHEDFNFWSNLLCVIDYTPWISGAAQPKLTKDNLGSIMLPKPPKDERVMLADFLTKTEKMFAPLTSATIKSIEKLKEYRSSLITSAVTGQIDVRKEVVA